MMLPLDDFKAVVKNTVLIAIDLILENKEGQVLLGRRNNKPAQGFLFVPGGRIFKNEKTADALERISLTEIGIKICEKDVVFNGIFEHIYDENFFGDGEFNTHYLVISCKAKIDSDMVRADYQHLDLKFYDKEYILNANDVHIFTKNYFKSTDVNNKFL